jgi:hypothetical protein
LVGLKNESATGSAIQNRRQLCDVLSLTLLLGVSSDKASTTHPPIRRAVDNLVRPELNSDASEPDYQQLETVENPVVAVGFEISSNDLATETKRREVPRRNLLILLIEPTGPEPLASALPTEAKNGEDCLAVND